MKIRLVISFDNGSEEERDLNVNEEELNIITETIEGTFNADCGGFLRLPYVYEDELKSVMFVSLKKVSRVNIINL